MDQVTVSRELLRQTIEALAHGHPPGCKDGMTDSGGVYPWGEPVSIPCPICKAETALRTALEQPVAEPVAWGVDWGIHGDRSCVSIIKKHANGVLEVVATEYGPVGSAPQAQQPAEVPFLTDSEILEMADDGVFLGDVKEIARAVESAVRKKAGLK